MPGYVEHLLFNRDEWRNLIAAEAADALTEELLAGGSQVAAIAERLGFIGAFDVTNPEVTAWLESYTFKFAAKIADTASDALRTTLTAGLENGETIRDLRQRILDDPVIGPQADKYRAEMIARTESVRAQGAGEKQAWENTNALARAADMPPVFVARIWRVNPDACPYCQAIDGMEVSLEQVFFEQGASLDVEGAGHMSFGYEAVDTPPLHPNCRCSLESVLSEGYQ